MPLSQEFSNNPYPESNQPIPRIDTYIFKIHFNIVLPSTPSFPNGLFSTDLLLKIWNQSYLLSFWLHDRQ